jgi:hypothetical protein
MVQECMHMKRYELIEKSTVHMFIDIKITNSVKQLQYKNVCIHTYVYTYVQNEKSTDSSLFIDIKLTNSVKQLQYKNVCVNVCTK